MTNVNWNWKENATLQTKSMKDCWAAFGKGKINGVK